MNRDDIRTQFNQIAKKYDEGRRCFIPCFDDYYVRSVSLLKKLKPTAAKVVDLGAGTGLLTKEMYLLYPEASFTLIDLSDDMLDVARQRFKGLGQFEYLMEDYTSNLPVDADIFCSALSIHHLDNDTKQHLDRAIYEALPAGGVFINLDQFCADSPIVNEAWNTWWFQYIEGSGITDEAKARWLERKQLDKEVSVPTTIKWLNDAGFNHVECVYQFMKFGTLIAVKS